MCDPTSKNVSCLPHNLPCKVGVCACALKGIYVHLYVAVHVINSFVVGVSKHINQTEQVVVWVIF